MTAVAIAPLSGKPPPYTEAHRPYEPFGKARDLWTCRDPECLIAGPAGTGKSRAALEKLHACALRWPGMRALVVRKTRASLSETALMTYEEKVLPAGDPMVAKVQRNIRQVYKYENGSRVVAGGMDMASRIMSTEYDLVYCQEATELTEDDWETLTTRLRNGVMPYQQLMADCNPDRPTHWLKQRCDRGLTVLLESRHEDNPIYYDRRRRVWTPQGENYILGKLERLTGARKERLRYGRWAAAEGLVYEGWDRRLHVLPPRELPAEWRRVWSVDFGYTNAFVGQCWAIDPDGRMYLEWELYRTQRLVEDHARDLLQRAGARVEGDRVDWSGGKRPSAIVCDHADAEGRATLESRLRLSTTKAEKEIAGGIQAVQARLRAAGDGKPRLYVMADALVSRDEALSEAKKPLCTEQEFDGYQWPKGQDGKPAKEEPVDVDNHGLDALRYAVVYMDGIGKGWAQDTAFLRRLAEARK